jgi:ribosomal protein S18 acetylase RimI-like enzyme
MIIEPFRQEDIAAFLHLAARENWVAEPWEFDFLLSSFPQGCFTARGENGEHAGFVTALRHEKSGWIGNLIVAEQFRGRGFGETLFRNTLDTLRDVGVETVWLTASTAGKSLYEKHGFKRVDTINRWVGAGRQRHVVHDGCDKAIVSPAMSRIDCQAWGDRRNSLLAATAGRGKVLRAESGFAVLQPSGNDVQFGPVSAMDSFTAEKLFDEALRTVQAGTKIYIDVPSSNRSAMRLFTRRRMRISGSNELMYAGTRPDYRPTLLYGLATMGSCG